jgi:hypothetical protein
MRCAVMDHLIEILDTVRAEQSTSRGDVDDAGKRKRLRAIEAFLDNHERTCMKCQQLNPLDRGSFRHSNRMN